MTTFLRRRLWIFVAAWFVVISFMRLSVLSSMGVGEPGYDGMLYRAATIRWLEGGDPWQLPESGAIYAAPPPTLLALLPFAVLPELLARVLLVALGVLANVWMIRRLGLPMWWLAFPPLVDGLWIANPHVFVAPLLVAGAAPLASIVKLYAATVPAIRLDLRALVWTGAVVLVTLPLLPWAEFVARWPEVSEALRAQSAGGGLSVWVTPILLPVAIVAGLLLGRERFAWWSIPVFWPYTQWYYSSIVMPVLTPLAAVVLSIPAPGATTVALVIALGEVYWSGRVRRRPRSAQRLRVSEATSGEPSASRANEMIDRQAERVAVAQREAFTQLAVTSKVPTVTTVRCGTVCGHCPGGIRVRSCAPRGDDFRGISCSYFRWVFQAGCGLE